MHMRQMPIFGQTGAWQVATGNARQPPLFASRLLSNFDLAHTIDRPKALHGLPKHGRQTGATDEMAKTKSGSPWLCINLSYAYLLLSYNYVLQTYRQDIYLIS